MAIFLSNSLIVLNISWAKNLVYVYDIIPTEKQSVDFSLSLHNIKMLLKNVSFMSQVAAGSNEKSLLFTGHIDGVDNIFSEKLWLLFSKANKLKINVN